MPTFLSQSWFDKVNELTTQAGELNVPSNLKDLSINLNIKDAPDGQNQVSLAQGTLHQGFNPDAKTTLTLDSATLRSVFLEHDMGEAMQAFMSGKIKVDGDMSQLMTVQTAKPSNEQTQLFQEILKITE